MVKMIWRTYGLNTAILLSLVLVDASMAFRFPLIIKNEQKPSFDGFIKDSIDNDLTALVRPAPTDQSGIYSRAIQLLRSMQMSPSCYRIAASRLLNSCQNIDGSTHDGEAFLDHIKSLYAAQLALCEIQSAGSAVPADCISLSLNKFEGTQSFKESLDEVDPETMRKPETGKRLLSQCLAALESRPQSWTSYSNSRQNAVIICQASRVDIEKDEIIKLYRSMAETSSNVDLALSRTSNNADDALAKHKEFALAIEAFQKRLLQDLEVQSRETQLYVLKLKKGIDQAIQLLLSKVISASKEVDLEVTDLGKNIQKSKTDAVELEKNIDRLFQQVVLGASELASSHTNAWELSHARALELQQSLDSIRSVELTALFDGFGIFQTELHSSTKLVSTMYARQNALDERLINLDRGFANLEFKAGAFYAAQASQVETQARLHNQIERMQTDMQAAYGLLTRIISGVSGLQAVIEETSAKITQLGFFGGLIPMISRWGLVMLTIFILYQLHPKCTGYLVIAIIILSLLNAKNIPKILENAISRQVPNDAVLIHYASGYQIRLTFILTLLTFTFILSIIILAFRYSKLLTNLRKLAIDLTSTFTSPIRPLQPPNRP